MKLWDVLFDRLLEKRLRKRRFSTFQDFVRAYRKALSPEILYFGDSVVQRVSFHDEDKSTLGDILRALVRPEKSLLCISHTAYHMGVFNYFVRALRVMRSKPESIVLPINVRSFSPQWHNQPEYQYEQEIEIMKGFICRPSGRIGLLDVGTDRSQEQQRFLELSVAYPETTYQKVGEFAAVIENKPTENTPESMARRRDIFIYHYLHPLESSHPKLSNLKNIIDETAQMKIQLFLYLTPVNYEAGIRFVGNSFMKHLEEKRTVLNEFIDRNSGPHVVYADYLTLVTQEEFFNTHDANEHLAYPGRQKLAGEIAQMLKAQYEAK